MSILYATALFSEDIRRNFFVASMLALVYLLFFAGLAALALHRERFAWPAFILAAGAAPLMQVMVARITLSS